ncbi:hypothetical protein LTR17_019470 [Elasticomyces elasticus]|nr:hypothetical protein LTR17_019470 [Elasticomyces elasticus]
MRHEDVVAGSVLLAYIAFFVFLAWLVSWASRRFPARGGVIPPGPGNDKAKKRREAKEKKKGRRGQLKLQ